MKLARRYLRYSSSQGQDPDWLLDDSTSDSMSDDERAPRSNMVTIDTSRIDDVIQDFELIFDTAKPGRYDDAAKLASLSTMTDCPMFKKLIRGWVKNGIPTGNGRKVKWRDAK